MGAESPSNNSLNSKQDDSSLIKRSLEVSILQGAPRVPITIFSFLRLRNLPSAVQRDSLSTGHGTCSSASIKQGQWGKGYEETFSCSSGISQNLVVYLSQQ